MSSLADPIKVDAGDLGVGDVVKLSGRGPVLTVVATAGNFLREGAGQVPVPLGHLGVQWFDVTGIMRSAVLPAKSLVRHAGEPGSMADGLYGGLIGGGRW